MRCFHNDLYGIFRLNSWTLYVCTIAMWHRVQSRGVLEVLKTGCSLKDCIEHVTNLKYEKERNSVAESMKPESTSFSKAFSCSQRGMRNVHSCKCQLTYVCGLTGFTAPWAFALTLASFSDSF